ncbi:MAG: ABC transporter ATP-binding protein, partial [Desulfuromonadales bacterium]|nr:ABC transporter ATP-binding protein [Desulfuromonadales bacterium]
THDLGIVAERSQETIIMYSGQIVETGATKDILNNPYHPYTKGLLASLPQNSLPGGQLHTIPGTVSKNMGNISKCIFSDRCPEALERCFKEKQELKEKEKNRYVACWRAL